jgi:molybdopterin converting factor small subunit
VRVHLGGYLNWYDPARRAWLNLDACSVLQAGGEGRVDPPSPVGVALHLGLPRGEIALVVVNGRVADLDGAVLKSDDTVEFYPPIGGG